MQINYNIVLIEGHSTHLVWLGPRKGSVWRSKMLWTSVNEKILEVNLN